MSMTIKKTSEDLRTERRRLKNPCSNLIVASLWPKKDNNLGTLSRTCDAVGACLAVPYVHDADKAIRKGNTIGDKVCLHRMVDPIAWLEHVHKRSWIIGVELAHNAIQLKALEPAKSRPTIIVLGHEAQGIPKEAWTFLDQVVEIPMKGVGNSLNVAVAGSLVLYRLAGMA